MKYFVVRYVHTEFTGWKKYLFAHLEYLKDLIKEGSLLMSGPLQDSKEGEKEASIVLLIVAKVYQRMEIDIRFRNFIVNFAIHLIINKNSMDISKIVDRLTLAMIEFDKGDPMRIQHFMKVHRFAQLIARCEKVDEHTQYVTELAAVVHDIGIHPAEAKYGKSNGNYQEELGPEPARQMLQKLGIADADIERVCYLVGHHHTYTNIDGIDYQILVEADFLVNLYEDNISEHGVDGALNHIFKTETGRRLCKLQFKEHYDFKKQ